MKIKRIGLIAGNGNFPLLVADAAKSSGIKVVAVAIKSEAEKRIESIADETVWVGLGQAKKLIEAFKSREIKYAVMAGKVNKVTLIKESLRLDSEAKNIIKKLANKKDDTLLSAIADRLNEVGIELIDSTLFIRDMMPAKGVLTKRRPIKRELEDIKFGFEIAKEMGSLDIGQSVIIKDKAVIAVEAIEGTDEAIKRAGTLAGKRTVVVKVSKPNQDMRFDVPVVGLNTIESLKCAKASVLAIEAKKVIVFEKDKVIKEAEKAGISIIAV